MGKVKLKMEDALSINMALSLCSEFYSKQKDIEPSVSYGLALALKRLRPYVKEHNEDNQARLDSFVKKDEEGNLIVKDEKYIFLDKKAGDAEFKKLMEKEIEIEFEPIYKSKHTDKFPAIAQAELLDIIIIDKNKKEDEKE